MLRLFLLTAFIAAADESLKPAKPVTADILNAAKPGDWRKIDPKNTVYMELASGRVIIELAPDFAPEHVKNIKALIKEKYWDGLAIVRVQENYVVQWGDPGAEKPETKRKMKKAKETLPAEFDRAWSDKLPFTVLPDKDTYASETGISAGFPAARDRGQQKMWLTHCYGMVGAGRNVPADSGGGAELYAVIGHAPRHLDRNVTLVGRVIQGMELLTTLPRGTGPLGFYEKPEQRVQITSVRLASDVPSKERVELEALRTDTDVFKKLIEARRNRVEDWFHNPANAIDVCNMMLPVRKTQK